MSVAASQRFPAIDAAWERESRLRTAFGGV